MTHQLIEDKIDTFICDRNRFMHRTVSTTQMLFGNEVSMAAISMNNLRKIPKGTIGVITDFDEDPETGIRFATIRFPDGIYVNAAIQTFEIIL